MELELEQLTTEVRTDLEENFYDFGFDNREKDYIMNKNIVRRIYLKEIEKIKHYTKIPNAILEKYGLLNDSDNSNKLWNSAVKTAA